MTELVATTPGLYPLPDQAKERLADLKGHQKADLIGGDEGDDVVAAYADVREAFLARQRDAGLDRFVEGQARWDDMLAHPLAVHDSVETGGIVRYYDNNNFYRDPRVVDDLEFSGDVASELDAASALRGDDDPSLQAVLPGPYTLADLATDEHYGDEADFLDAVATFLAEEVEAFPAHETLFLLEPSLTENPPADGRDARASDAIDQVAAASDADVVVHTYWGALEERVYAHLMDADVEGVGLDFVSADPDQQLYTLSEYGAKDEIALGVVDGQNTLVEDAETVHDRVEWVLDGVQGTDFDRAYVTTNTELFYLPVNKFEAKLATLGDAVALAEVEA